MSLAATQLVPVWWRDGRVWRDNNAYMLHPHGCWVYEEHSVEFQTRAGVLWFGFRNGEIRSEGARPRARWSVEAMRPAITVDLPPEGECPSRRKDPRAPVVLPREQWRLDLARDVVWRAEQMLRYRQAHRRWRRFGMPAPDRARSRWLAALVTGERVWRTAVVDGFVVALCESAVPTVLLESFTRAALPESPVETILRRGSRSSTDLQWVRWVLALAPVVGSVADSMKDIAASGWKPPLCPVRGMLQTTGQSGSKADAGIRQAYLDGCPCCAALDRIIAEPTRSTWESVARARRFPGFRHCKHPRKWLARLVDRHWAAFLTTKGVDDFCEGESHRASLLAELGRRSASPRKDVAQRIVEALERERLEDLRSTRAVARYYCEMRLARRAVSHVTRAGSKPIVASEQDIDREAGIEAVRAARSLRTALENLRDWLPTEDEIVSAFSGANAPDGMDKKAAIALLERVGVLTPALQRYLEGCATVPVSLSITGIDVSARSPVDRWLVIGNGSGEPAERQVARAWRKQMETWTAWGQREIVAAMHGLSAESWREPE